VTRDRGAARKAHTKTCRWAFAGQTDTHGQRPSRTQQQEIPCCVTAQEPCGDLQALPLLRAASPQPSGDSGYNAANAAFPGSPAAETTAGKKCKAGDRRLELSAWFDRSHSIPQRMLQHDPAGAGLTASHGVMGSTFPPHTPTGPQMRLQTLT